MGWIADLAAGALKPISDMYHDAHESKLAKIQSDAKIAEAQANATIARIEKAADNDAAWDTIWATQADKSWKDEWFTVLLSIPLILAFIPFLAPFVLEGFKVLSQCPEWYRYLVSAAVAASFGLKGVIGVMNRL